MIGILGHDGAMADAVCVPACNLHAVPDSIDDRRAVFIEPLAAAFRVAEQVPIGPSTRLTVVGDGKLGLLCAWVARGLGADVTLVGKHPEKLALGGEGGPADPPGPSRFNRPIPGRGRGLHGVDGRPGDGPGIGRTLRDGRAQDHRRREARDQPRPNRDRRGPRDRLTLRPVPKAIEALASGSIDVRPLIGAEFSLDHAEEAFRAAAGPGARKVIINV